MTGTGFRKREPVPVFFRAYEKGTCGNYMPFGCMKKQDWLQLDESGDVQNVRFIVPKNPAIFYQSTSRSVHIFCKYTACRKNIP